MTTSTGARVDRARVAAGHSQRSLAEATGISQPTLSRIMSGDRTAKMPELIKIAWATGHTIAQLTGLETVADRARCSTSDPGTDPLREKLLDFLELDDHLDDQAISAAQRPRPVAAEAEPRAAAARFRRANHLGEQPLGDLVAVIVQTGIDVAVVGAGPEKHGLTLWDPAGGSTFIGVARTPDPMRQRSTLAHELGHVLFGDFGAATSEEIRADDFARHLLVPIEGLRQFVANQGPVTESVLSQVVQRFLVSPQLAAIALQEAGCVDDDTKQQWMTLTAPTLACRFGWSDYYRALQTSSNESRAPQRLLARTINGYLEGVVSAQTIATLRGIPLDIAEAELRAAGIEPMKTPIPWATADELRDVHVDLAALDADLDDGDRISSPSIILSETRLPHFRSGNHRFDDG